MTKTTLTALAMAASVAASGLIYPTTLQVTDITGDIATTATSTGYRYGIPAEDYEIGDLVSALMFDGGVPGKIDDDLILSARYAGQFN